MSMDEASAQVVVAAKTPGRKSQQDLLEETRRKAEEMGSKIPGFNDLKDKVGPRLPCTPPAPRFCASAPPTRRCTKTRRQGDPASTPERRPHVQWACV